MDRAFVHGAQVLHEFSIGTFQLVTFSMYCNIVILRAGFMQMALYESLLASPHRTLNGEEAYFFFVPVLDSCIITRADDAPHLSLQVYFINCYFYWNLSVKCTSLHFACV